MDSPRSLAGGTSLPLLTSRGWPGPQHATGLTHWPLHLEAIVGLSGPEVGWKSSRCTCERVCPLNLAGHLGQSTSGPQPARALARTPRGSQALPRRLASCARSLAPPLQLLLACRRLHGSRDGSTGRRSLGVCLPEEGPREPLPLVPSQGRAGLRVPLPFLVKLGFRLLGPVALHLLPSTLLLVRCKDSLPCEISQGEQGSGLGTRGQLMRVHPPGGCS